MEWKKSITDSDTPTAVNYESSMEKFWIIELKISVVMLIVATKNNYDFNHIITRAKNAGSIMLSTIFK